MSEADEEKQPQYRSPFEDVPVTIRFPAPGKKEFYTGLSRNALYQLWKLGLLRTAIIRQPGKVGRGVRVIFLRELLKYLESQSSMLPEESPELPENPPSSARQISEPKKQRRKQ